MKYFRDNFRAVVTFKNGQHMILRMTYRKVAKFVTEFRKMQADIFGSMHLWDISEREGIALNDVKKTKFINERTGDELLTLV